LKYCQCSIYTSFIDEMWLTADSAEFYIYKVQLFKEHTSNLVSYVIACIRKSDQWPVSEPEIEVVDWRFCRWFLWRILKIWIPVSLHWKAIVCIGLEFFFHSLIHYDEVASNCWRLIILLWFWDGDGNLQAVENVATQQPTTFEINIL